MTGERCRTTRRGKAVWGWRLRAAGLLACAGLLASCGTQVRQGQTSSYLVLTNLQGASGATGTFGSTVLSDVVTIVNNVPTVFNDPGQASFDLQMKDPIGTAPSPNNSITLTQYHVEFVRSDGRNVPGVDVPYAFDGALTATVSGSANVGFTLVRHAAKEEAPLKALAFGGTPLTVIAKVTFYGHDQTGREVSTSGNIEITFWNFADA